MNPPTLASWLLRRIIPEEDRDGIIGDLVETLRLELFGSGLAGRWLWYWRQTLSLSTHFLRERINESRTESGSGTDTTLVTLTGSTWWPIDHLRQNDDDRGSRWERCVFQAGRACTARGLLAAEAGAASGYVPADSNHR